MLMLNAGHSGYDGFNDFGKLHLQLFLSRSQLPRCLYLPKGSEVKCMQ